jgi:AraC family transcriptional regulator
MNMTPEIKNLTEKKLIGKRMTMSMADNKTFELWRNFMPLRKTIKNNVNGDLISMQVFDPSHDFKNFNPHAQFEKWSAVEVTDFNTIPEGMESFTLVGGLYAVFIHRGPASAGAKTFQYIFGVWLPASDFNVDDRPHFELLGEKYKNEAPDSEEEVWIPVKRKNK